MEHRLNQSIPHSFLSSNTKCAADLYLPSKLNGALPCIVMGHGFSGTKDFAIPAFADVFSKNGFAVFAFDYRNFGDSNGMPRQVINIKQQRNDFKAAIEYVRKMEIIDSKKIILWGSSLSSGHVIDIASNDSSIAAVIAMVPFFDAIKGQGNERAPFKVLLKLLFSAIKDWIHGLLGLSPVLVPVVGHPGEFATMTEPEAKPIVDILIKEGSKWRNEFAPRIAFGMPRYKEGTVEKINAPILFCIAEKDLSASPEFAIQVGEKAKHGKIIRYPVGHFRLYAGEMREKAIIDQLQFLKENFTNESGEKQNN
ncbi:MAG TPA: alpha/beta hydrolase [Anaerolineales bacterium]|nr:alpha/beta hydrolase [Anaerolineales bacterium]